MPLIIATPSMIASAVSIARSFRPARPLRATLIIGRPSSFIAVEHVGRGRPAQILDDEAVGEEEDAVGHGGCARLVRDHQGRLAVAVDRVAQQGQDLLARVRVEVARRLVGEQHRRPVDERPRDRDALLLPAGELGRAGGARRSSRPTLPTTSSTHALSTFPPARSSGSVTFSSAVSIGRRLKNWKMKPMWLRRRSVSCWSPMPGDVGAVDRHAAGGRPVETGEDVHERRLAGARRPHDRGELPLHDVERDALAARRPPSRLRRTGALRLVRTRPRPQAEPEPTRPSG